MREQPRLVRHDHRPRHTVHRIPDYYLITRHTKHVHSARIRLSAQSNSQTVALGWCRFSVPSHNFLHDETPASAPCARPPTAGSAEHHQSLTSTPAVEHLTSHAPGEPKGHHRRAITGGAPGASAMTGLLPYCRPLSRRRSRAAASTLYADRGVRKKRTQLLHSMHPARLVSAPRPALLAVHHHLHL